MNTVITVLSGLTLLVFGVISSNASNGVRYLDLVNNPNYKVDQRVGFRSDELEIFCYRGETRSVSHTFRTIQMRLKIKNDEFVQYEGNTAADVRQHYEDKRSLFTWVNLLGGSKKREMRLNPFNQTCLGVETSQSYSIHLHLVRFDLVKFGMFCAGVWLFLYARHLTKMPFFYYTSGVGLGVSLSVFLMVWLISRQLPKKSLMFSSLIGGWALIWYFLQSAWDNAKSLVIQYQIYVFYYVCAMGLISFITCYRIGPPTNPRSIDIVQWSLQLIAVALIYLSSDYHEVPVAIIFGILVVYYFPVQWLNWIRAAWRRRFPPKVRLLTVEEFEAQARENTRIELAKMMEFCGSPEAKPWRTVARLKNPKRFAEFIEHGVHVTEEEVFDHEQSLMETSNACDDYSSDESDNDASGSRTPQQQQQRRNHQANAPEISDDEDDVDQQPTIRSAMRPSPRANHITSYGWQPTILIQNRGVVTRRLVGRNSTPRHAAPEISSDDD